MPRRIKLMYNEDVMLIDTLIDRIDVNPAFAPDFFQGLPLDQISNTELMIPPLAPQASAQYGDAEVFENRYVVGPSVFVSLSVLMYCRVVRICCGTAATWGT